MSRAAIKSANCCALKRQCGREVFYATTLRPGILMWSRKITKNARISIPVLDVCLGGAFECLFYLA